MAVSWDSPLANFATSLRQTAALKFHFTFLYDGQLIDAVRVPWHYTPVWMLKTIPISVRGLTAIGLVVLISAGIRSPRSWLHERWPDLFVLAWLLGPIAAAAILGTALYNSWRHHFFVYPAMLIVAVTGLEYLSRGRGRVLSFLLRGVLVIDAALVLSFMVRNRPFQDCYFNALSGGIREARAKMELDYWGLSYRRALEQVLEVDSRSIIPINVADEPGKIAAAILLPEQRRRLSYVDRSRADYFLTSYMHCRDAGQG